MAADHNDHDHAFGNNKDLVLPIVPHLEDCLLLRGTARALGLPLNVVATGLVFVHRCRRSGQPWALSSHDMACGCLYAAAKAEEVRTRMSCAAGPPRPEPL